MRTPRIAYRAVGQRGRLSPLARPRDGLRMSSAVRDRQGARGSFTLPGPKNVGQPRARRQPSSGLGRWTLGRQIGAVPPRVHVMLVPHLAGCAFLSGWRRPEPKPPVRSADPQQQLCDSRRRSSRPRPDQESPIDPAQVRARGRTKPLLVRQLQNQPTRFVDGVPEREGASRPRRQARNSPVPTKSRKLRLFRQTRPPRTRTASGLAVGVGLIVTDRVTVDGLGVAVTVWVGVVSSRIGDREGFFVADGVAVDSWGGVGSSVGRLDESAGLGFVGVGLGISGRGADLVGVGRDAVGVGSWLAERDGGADPSMFPPPAHDVSTTMATAKPAIFMTSVPTLSPDPALLRTPTPDATFV